ncbi:MAG: PglZ domain-containing protein [candidate division KSB1 bacterium]|nr:PglZ domain-containing protein [candidate division KSB1 bacterium]
MTSVKGKILWVDDEIELLRPHIMFLEERGYQVTPVTNAEDALSLIQETMFDLVLLDEMLNGMDGLTALTELKELNPWLPVIMITKSEEERLMEEAIGSKIDDYLTKPVNPSQILLVCKKILESKEIERARISRDYASEFNKVALALMNPLTWKDWIEIYVKLCEWEVELDRYPGLGLRQTLLDQKRDCNLEFGKFVERSYQSWLQDREEAPPLSVDLVREHLYPLLKAGEKVIFVVMDNLRLDQWLTMEPLLYPYFKVSRSYYFSILPSATSYSRNAIFSGLFPSELEDAYPEIWEKGNDDESSRNRYERQLLDRQLEELGLQLRPEPKYIKVLDAQEAKSLEKHVGSYAKHPLVSIVLNFVDFLAHSRSDSQLLKEIASDEPAYRSLTRSWFEHSHIFKVLKQLSQLGNTVILTSDHGSILSKRGAKVIGDRETSTNLRYKYGKSLKCDPKYAMVIKEPKDFKLPARRLNTNYLIAKEDYYFVYPTDYHYYLNYYRDSFQHGGISLEEMILPVVKLEAR